MIRAGVLVALALLLAATPADAQPRQAVTCVASIAVPGSPPPPNVDVLSPTSGALIIRALGGDPLGADVVDVVVIRGPQNVAVLVMRQGFACRLQPVPVALWERAKRLALGVDG